MNDKNDLFKSFNYLLLLFYFHFIIISIVLKTLFFFSQSYSTIYLSTIYKKYKHNLNQKIKFII